MEVIPRRAYKYASSHELILPHLYLIKNPAFRWVFSWRMSAEIKSALHPVIRPVVHVWH